jgi:SAM-dependent methyltransferase
MINEHTETAAETAEQVWEGIYRATSPDTSGRPGTILKRFVEGLAPGCALELGCGKGDDAVWLARQGWAVLAVDISATALGYATENAKRAGVAEHITFERHDLARTFPVGRFDLVTASFFHSPVLFPRAEVFQRAAATVTSGGHVLITDHGSRAPWSWSAPETRYPTPDETLASLQLTAAEWQPRHVEAIERLATGPDGQTATVIDNVLFLQRR